jgi:hypothetical protein
MHAEKQNFVLDIFCNKHTNLVKNSLCLTCYEKEGNICCAVLPYVSKICLSFNPV